MDEDQLVSQLHSLEIRPDYSWQPSEFLSRVMNFNQSLFNTATLTDGRRKAIIEQHPGIKDMDYQPPDTIPVAARNMKHTQTKQDRSLKRFQYLASGTFRPLDVLALEISTDDSNPNVQRYLRMLADCLLLILNLTSEMTKMRKNIAFQAINPRFSSDSPSSDNNYIMPLDDFQTALAQQTTNLQNVQKASRFGQRAHFTHTNQNNSSHAPQLQQFFRAGPSSQQGGYTNNHNNNRSNFNNPRPNFNNFNKSNTDKKSNNPFRQQQQQQQQQQQ
ncbi:hypothetical protein K501DRAFT_335169 [Backusella circina FSU 941]|nr:hypothetical protein K501DRAFT_335169 [Backusella circina FSU 941]